MTTTLGPFEVVRPLGRGGMGTVFEVRLPGDPRALALKLLERQTGHALERFRREGELAARLDHPGIVAVRSAGELPDGRPYLLFDLVPGRSLSQLLEETGPLPEAQALDLGLQLAEALAHAHAREIVHRDVKAENVLLDAEGRVRLADFGVALAADQDRLSRSGQITGTLDHMAPEQVTGGEIGPWTDVYAAGVVLFELLTGSRPFAEAANHSELMVQVVSGTAPSVRALRPELSRGAARLVARCLANAPAGRYPDGAALAADLARLQAEPQRGGPARPRRMLWALGALLALGAGGVAAALAGGRPSSAPPPAPAATPAQTAAPRASRAVRKPSPSPPQALRLLWRAGPRQALRYRFELEVSFGSVRTYLVWDSPHKLVERSPQVFALEGTLEQAHFGVENQEHHVEVGEEQRALAGLRYAIVVDAASGGVQALEGLDELGATLTAHVPPNQAGVELDGVSGDLLACALDAAMRLLPGPIAELPPSWTTEAALYGPGLHGSFRRRIQATPGAEGRIELRWTPDGRPRWVGEGGTGLELEAEGRATWVPGHLEESHATVTLSSLGIYQSVQLRMTYLGAD